MTAEPAKMQGGSGAARGADAPLAEADGSRTSLGADQVLAVVAAKLSALETLAVALEESLGAAISAAGTLQPEAIETLQRIDFLRQSLKDNSAIVDAIREGVCWIDGREVSLTQLQDRVDMHGSLAGLEDHGDGVSRSDHDIWL